MAFGEDFSTKQWVWVIFPLFFLFIFVLIIPIVIFII